MALQKANRPILTNGRCEGVITSFGEGNFIAKRKKGRTQIEELVTSTLLEVEVKGLIAPIPIKCWLGVNLNDAPTDTRGRGRQTTSLYNRLTTACLKLGLIDKSELATADEARLEKLEADFAGLEGLVISFVAARNEKGYLDIDLETLQIVGGDTPGEEKPKPKAETDDAGADA